MSVGLCPNDIAQYLNGIIYANGISILRKVLILLRGTLTMPLLIILSPLFLLNTSF